MTGLERPAPSNRLSSWVWTLPLQAKVSTVGIINRSLERPLHLRQLKPGRQSDKRFKQFPKHICPSEEGSNTASQNPQESLDRKAGNCPLGTKVTRQQVLNAQDGPSTVPGSEQKGRGGCEPLTVPLEKLKSNWLKGPGEAGSYCVTWDFSEALILSNTVFLHQYYGLNFWLKYIQ